VIVTTITISAILIVIMTIRAPRKVADAEPHQGHSASPTMRLTCQDHRQQLEHED
jgi:hypothetical protein